MSLLFEILRRQPAQRFQIPLLQSRQLPASWSAVNYLA
jgi:hypothetical protein